MTDREAAKVRRKKQAWNIAKITAAIATISTAIDGYSKIQAQQNLMLEALSTQLNALTAKVSYLEGRMDGLAVAPTSAPMRSPASVIDERVDIVPTVAGPDEEEAVAAVVIPQEVANQLLSQPLPATFGDLERAVARQRAAKNKEPAEPPKEAVLPRTQMMP